MPELADWLARAGAALDLDLAELARSGALDQALVLDLARDVAHEVARPAAPLTAYLLGMAVGQGADPVAAAAILTRLAQTYVLPP